MRPRLLKLLAARRPARAPARWAFSRRTAMRVVGLVSMIDVIFLLLIYFQLTHTSARTEPDLASALPPGPGGAPTAPPASLVENRDVLVAVAGGDEEHPHVRLGQGPCADWAELGAKLRAARQCGARRVVLAVEEAVAYGLVAQALNESKNAGFTDIAFRRAP